MRLWKLSAEVSAKIVSDLDPAKIASFNIGSTLDEDTAITVWLLKNKKIIFFDWKRSFGL